MHLQTVLDSIGVSVWQMALAPSNNDIKSTETKPDNTGNGFFSHDLNDYDEHEISESEDDSESPDAANNSINGLPRVAIGCDDGCVRIYGISDFDELIYVKSLPRVSGEISSPE